MSGMRSYVSRLAVPAANGVTGVNVLDALGITPTLRRSMIRGLRL